MTDFPIIDTKTSDEIAMHMRIARNLQASAARALEYARGWDTTDVPEFIGQGFAASSAQTCRIVAVERKINAEQSVYKAWALGAMSKSSNERPFYKRATEQRIEKLIESNETETASDVLLKLMTGTPGLSAQQALMRIGNKLICENDDTLPHITGTRNYYRPYRLKMQRDAYAMQQRFDFVKSVTIKHGVALLRK
jgi:hypothetical protein